MFGLLRLTAPSARGAPATRLRAGLQGGPWPAAGLGPCPSTLKVLNPLQTEQIHMTISAGMITPTLSVCMCVCVCACGVYTL